jgi:DNA polymerase-3 subunit chi
VAEVVFLTGVVDLVDFAVRLMRKKYREGTRVAVYGPTALLQRIDQALWASEPLDFVPHLWLRSGAALPSPGTIDRTPLWLLSEAAPAALRCDSGVNLGRDDLDLVSMHGRLAEVVSIGDDERTAARARWKRYTAQGHQVVHRPQG